MTASLASRFRRTRCPAGLALLLVLTAALATPDLRAQATLALQPNGLGYLQNYGGSLGFRFSVNQNLPITTLGYWDDNRDGLSGSTISVAIFDLNSATIVSGALASFSGTDGTLTGSSFSQEGTSRFGQLRVITLATPVTLTAGNYVFAAWGYDASNRLLNLSSGSANTIDTLGGAVSFIGAYFGNAGEMPNTYDDWPTKYAIGTFGIGGGSGSSGVLAPWSGGAGTSDWFTAGNWQSGAVASTNDGVQNGTIQIAAAGAISTRFTIAEAAGTTATVRVTGATADWAVSQTLQVGSEGTGTLELVNGGTVNVGSGSGIVQVGALGSLVFGSGQASGTLQAGSISLAASTSRVVFSGSDSSLTFSTPISGEGGVTMSGSGTLRLAGTQTYSGQTTVSSGALHLVGSLPNSTVALASGTTLTFGHNSTQSIGGLSGSGNVAFSNYVPTYPWESSYGYQQLSVGDNNASTTFSGNFTSTASLSTSTTLTKSGSGTLTLTGSSASGIRFSVGAGTLTLSPTNPAAMLGQATASGYSSPAGTLVIAPPNSTPLGLSAINLNSGGKLLVTSQTATALAGTTVYFYGGNAEFTSGTVLGGISGFNNATLTAASSGGSGPAYFSTIAFGANNQNNSYYGTLSGGANVGLNLVKVGTGTWSFSGALGSYSTLEVQAGVVELQNSLAAPVTLNGGTLRSASALTLTGGLSAGSTTGTIDTPYDVTVSGSLNGGWSGPVQLNKAGAGTLTLTGFNNGFGAIYADTLNVTAGAVAISDGFQLGAGNARLRLDGGTLRALDTFTDSHALTLGTSGGTLAVAASERTLTWAAAISGTGALTKTGAGTLALTGTNTYTGATAINAGTFLVNGSLANTAVTIADGATLGGSGSIGGLTTIQSGAHLAPGNSPGVITFTNGLTLADGTILDFQLGDPLNAAASDRIDVTGGTFSGPTTGTITLNLADAGGFGAGTYDLIRYSGATYDANSLSLANFDLPATLSGFTLAFAFSGSALQLTATAVPEPATYAALFGALVLGLAIYRRRSDRH